MGFDAMTGVIKYSVIYLLGAYEGSALINMPAAISGGEGGDVKPYASKWGSYLPKKKGA